MSKRNRKECEQRDDVDVTQQKNVDDEGNTDSNKVMDIDAPLPRPKRRKRRAKADRGLPPDSELKQLAEVYLERQHKHWPNLIASGILPSKSETVISEMVEDFKLRRRTRSVNVGLIQALAKACPKLGGNYNRYSCDNSSPHSIVDQMVNSLDKAKEEGRFVPWSYIFCDYSVTGLDPSRVGYSSYKAVLSDPNQRIETTYVDDFTRASRDELEWWRLAALSKRLNKRMIGASDGFDLSDPNSDILMTMFGLVSRMFIKGIKEKVKRGMKGAARRGTSLGKLSLGFTRRVHRDGNGNIVFRPDGKPRHEPCIDPETGEYRRLMYDLFVKECWSPYRIARHFSKLRVDGSTGWTGSAIKKLLWSPTAIGVFIWGKHRSEFDFEEEKWVRVRNPRSEWEVYFNRDRAIVPMDIWKVARRKLADIRQASPITGRKRSRNQITATTLFSGTLVCGYCGSEIKLTRSTEKYKQFGCLNGVQGNHDCCLTCSKSTRIVEQCLLNYLCNVLLAEDKVAALVTKANQYLADEAQKPREDLRPLKSEIRKREASINRLLALIENEEDEQLCLAHHRRIKELQRNVNELRKEVREAEAACAAPPPPLDLSAVKRYVMDLRTLLEQEVPAAAEANSESDGADHNLARAHTREEARRSLDSEFQPQFSFAGGEYRA